MPLPPPIRGSLLLLTLATLSAAACADDQPAGPAARPGGARIEALVAEGCTGFTVHTADRTQVTVTESVAPACGGVRPVVAGQPAFDAQGLVLRIPVVIRNSGPDPVEDPARVWSAEDLLKVLDTERVVAGTETPLAFVNADSTGTDLGTGTAGIRSYWRYDARLPQRNGAAFLQPDSSSGTGWIEVAVHSAVRSFQVVFHAKAGIRPVNVPETIPDTIPEALYAAPNVESASDLMSGTFLRNVVVVMFREDATQAQKETAVRLVQGEVVGGYRYFEGDGKYYVRIPHDGTAGPLLAALDRLEALPQVEGVGPEFIFRAEELVNYMRPTDGAGWTQWELDPARAAGHKWGLEAIEAPMGWGCAMGSTGMRVAVVDHGFQSSADLNANIAVRYFPYAWPDTVKHGTNVASVLAARGSNGVGMTGTAWYAGLELWGLGLNWMGVPTTGTNGRYSIRNGVDVLAQAVRRGAPVVNMSIGLKWDDILKNRQQPLGIRADTARVRRFDRTLRATMHRALARRARSGVGPPLIVFAAGNDAVDAYWAGYPNLVDEFPDWVLAVGAATASGGAMSQAGFSNWGRLVELYAPGDGVGALNPAGSVVPVRGTSFAAPMVSGVAALLFAFDPRLTATDVKDLLLEGAAAGGRSIANGPFIGGPRYVLNAHESLKAAGARPGAPLCGNRVWTQGTSLYAERQGGAAEALGPALLTEPALEVEPLHGGQYVQFRSGGSVGAIRWSRDGWFHSLPPGNATALRSGTLSSLMGYSHSRDTLVFANTGVVSGSDWWRNTPEIDVKLTRRTLAGDADFTTIKVQKLDLPEQVICIERTAEEPRYCTLTYSMMRWWMFRVGYPQNDQPALVAVSPMYGVLLDSTAWHPCLDDENYQCREVKSEQKQKGTRVYTVPWPAGNPTEIAHIEDQTSIFWLGQSETDSTLVLGRGAWWITKWFSPTAWRQNGDGEYDIQGEMRSCGIEYRRLAGFGQIRSIASDNTCNWNQWDRPTYAGGGGIAASRAPAARNTTRRINVYQTPVVMP